LEVLSVVRQLLDVQINEKVYGKVINRNPASYRNKVEVGTIATVIMCSVFGYHNNRIPTCLRTLESLPRTHPNASKCHDYCLPLLQYLFRFILPASHPNIKIEAVKDQKVISFVKSMCRADGAITFPVWSNNYIQSLRLGPTDGDICNGHMWEYACIMDQVIPDFYEMLIVSQSFTFQADHAKYDRSLRKYA